MRSTNQPLSNKKIKIRILFKKGQKRKNHQSLKIRRIGSHKKLTNHNKLKSKLDH